MIDGTYNIALDTPLGHKSGTVTIRTAGETAVADIDAPMIGKQRIEGRVDGDAFSAQGSLKIMLVGKVDYTLKGTVIDDYLRVDIQTNKGAFTLEGIRA